MSQYKDIDKMTSNDWKVIAYIMAYCKVQEVTIPHNWDISKEQDVVVTDGHYGVRLTIEKKWVEHRPTLVQRILVSLGIMRRKL